MLGDTKESYWYKKVLNGLAKYMHFSESGSIIGASLKLKSKNRDYESLEERNDSGNLPSPYGTAQNFELQPNNPFYQSPQTQPLHLASFPPTNQQPAWSTNPFVSSPVMSNQSNPRLSSHVTIRQDPANPLKTTFVKSGNLSPSTSPRF